MPGGGKTKNTVQLKNTGLEGSDEDYMMGEDEEFDESEEEYCSSLADDETEESSGEFDECVKNKIKKVGRKKSTLSDHKKEDNDIGGIRKHLGKNLRNKTRASSGKRSRVVQCNRKPRKKTKVSYGGENEDSDFNCSSEDEDEEFTLDIVDDEEELPVMKRRKVDMLEAQSAKGKNRKRNVKAPKRTRRKISIKKRVLKRKTRSRVKGSRGKASVAGKANRSNENGRGRSSDHEYTISEEEREQIREANEFCGRLTTNLRSSSFMKMIKEQETVPSERKLPGRKNKETMVDMKIELGKQVCGICLSEEGKRTVEGILNCCKHYFCFGCIMEWSKVESRCPLCKRRFTTISRTSQVAGAHDLSDVVISVPVRDQVYEPSEEELRGYVDPYENVPCTECHQGGDDSLMLLCDICDSPAHTYCVGLGREVPEGNWYCDGCKPALNPTPYWEVNNNLSVGSSVIHETVDLNVMYEPETSLSQETGAFTLHERRRIQQQIHLLINRSRQSERNAGTSPASGVSLFGSQVCRDVVVPLQGVPVQEVPHQQRRLPESTTPSLYGGEVRHHQASTSTDHSVCQPSQTEFSGTSARIGHGLNHQQLHPSNRLSNTGMDASIPPSKLRDTFNLSPEKEHVQFTVKHHLHSLSRNLDLDILKFKCIARTSTHTILAAVGHEHRLNEVFPVKTRLLICDHDDVSVAGQKTYPFAGQCSSCFNWFVRNVVREVMSSRLPILFK